MRTCEDVTIAMLITHTYYYLAQLHGKLGNGKKSAEYCHKTLARQLRWDQYEASWLEAHPRANIRLPFNHKSKWGRPAIP